AGGLAVAPRFPTRRSSDRVPGLAHRQAALRHVVEARVLAVAVTGARVGERLRAGREIEGAAVAGRISRLRQLQLRQPVVGEGAGSEEAASEVESVGDAGCI